jgi:hypothetical protein
MTTTAPPSHPMSVRSPAEWPAGPAGPSRPRGITLPTPPSHPTGSTPNAPPSHSMGSMPRPTPIPWAERPPIHLWAQRPPPLPSQRNDTHCPPFPIPRAQHPRCRPLPFHGLNAPPPIPFMGSSPNALPSHSIGSTPRPPLIYGLDAQRAPPPIPLGRRSIYPAVAPSPPPLSCHGCDAHHALPLIPRARWLIETYRPHARLRMAYCSLPHYGK